MYKKKALKLKPLNFFFVSTIRKENLMGINPERNGVSYCTGFHGKRLRIAEDRRIISWKWTLGELDANKSLKKVHPGVRRAQQKAAS